MNLIGRKPEFADSVSMLSRQYRVSVSLQTPTCFSFYSHQIQLATGMRDIQDIEFSFHRQI